MLTPNRLLQRTASLFMQHGTVSARTISIQFNFHLFAGAPSINPKQPRQADPWLRLLTKYSPKTSGQMVTHSDKESSLPVIMRHGQREAVIASGPVKISAARSNQMKHSKS